MHVSQAPLLHYLHLRAFIYSDWPVAPLFHWRSCMTSWSSFQDSLVLIRARIPCSYFIWVFFAGSFVSLSPLLGDPRSAMLLTVAGAVAPPSMTTAFLPPPTTVMTPGLSSSAIATSMSAGLPPTATSSHIISAVPPLPAVAMNPQLSLKVSG